MTRLRRLVLLAALAVAGTAPAAEKYGPSWRTQADARPAKVETTRTAVGLGDSGDPIGVEVKLWGDVGNIEKGHTYRLMYQLRIQTKKGELGPVLGDSGRANGVAYTLKTAVADENWNGLDARVDITRAMIAGMTGLPKDTNWGEPLLLRVEPQLFDVTADKFVSDGRPNCLFLAVDVRNGTVARVTPLPKWLSGSCGKVAHDALANLAKLDGYDPGENDLQDFFFDVLLGRVTGQRSDVPAVIAAIPVPLLKSEGGKYLDAYLDKVVRGTATGADNKPVTFEDEVKAAAKAKLAEK
jgi:hypothetical protein